MKAPGFFTWTLPTLLLAVLAISFARWQTTLNAQHLADLGEKTAARLALAIESDSAAVAGPDGAYALAREAIETPRVQYILIELPDKPVREFGSLAERERLATHTIALRGGGRVAVGTADLGWVAMAPLAVALITGTAIFLTMRLALFVRRREHEAIARLDRLARDFDATDSDDEPRQFGDLQTALDEIAMRVRDLRGDVREELERSTAALRATLEASRGRNTELEAARRDALVASAAKSEFLASISHEVRTPMDAILGYTELLGETPLDPRQRGYLAAIEQASQNLLSIVDDVLSLSRIEAGKLTIHEQPFSIRENVDSVAQMLAPSAYRKGLDFVRIVKTDVPETVAGDPLRVRQVLVNLLANAIKFTRAGHVRLVVEVAATRDGRAIVSFAISDTGIGISAAEQRALFEPFSRPGPDADTEQGTGLGLVITKRLCEAMHGDVDVTSSPGQGSRFTARLPVTVLEQAKTTPADLLAGRPVALYCADPEQRNWLGQCLDLDGAELSHHETLATLRAAVPPQGNAQVAVLVLTQRWFAERERLAELSRRLRDRVDVIALVSTSSRAQLREVESLLGGEAMPAHTPMHIVCERISALARPIEAPATEPPDTAAASAPQLAGLRVLVAEDNRFSREYLRTLLVRHGAETSTCCNGEQACEAIAKHDFDVVLMDLRMPVCDGISAMRRLRTSAVRPPPVIGLTAASDDCALAREAGMTECIVKPVRSAFLLDYLARLRRGDLPSTVSGNCFIDEEMRAELLVELPRHASRLRALFSQRAFASMLEEAHKINGTAALCGFFSLRAHAAELERRLRAGETDGLDLSLESALSEIDEVCTSLANS